MGIAVITDMATPALARFGGDEWPARSTSAPASPGEVLLHRGLRSWRRSEQASWKTTALRQRQGGDHIVTDPRMWITNGTQSDSACTTLVNTSDGEHSNKVVLLIIPLDAAGASPTKLLTLGNARL